MAWIDLSRAIHPAMDTFAGDPSPSLFPYSRARAEDPASYGATLVTLGSHTGTHVDAPAHFVEGGATIDEVPLDGLCGRAAVVDLAGGPARIDALTLEQALPEGAERVLLRTLRDPSEERAHLTESAARLLRRRGVRLVGIDELSVEQGDGSAYPVHRLLLDGEPPIIIVEGLDLRAAPAGPCELVVLPLKIAGCDGAPARAALRPLHPLGPPPR